MSGLRSQRSRNTRAGAYVQALSNTIDFGGLPADGATRYLWTLPMFHCGGRRDFQRFDSRRWRAGGVDGTLLDHEREV